MDLESLANELILDIYEYFNAVQLLRTFHGLNTRFDKLLHLYFQTYPLDLRGISKQDFDFICRNNLPLITNQISSIYLSNDDNTPEEPTLLFLYHFHFQQFTNLQSLSLYCIHSTDLISKIIFDCPHLIYLKTSKCNFDDDYVEKAELCINCIWSLSKLKYCYLDIRFFNVSSIPLPTIISSSLQYLSIENESYDVNDLFYLFKCTPNLRNLNIKIKDTSNSGQLTFSIPLLTKLKIYFIGSFDVLRDILHNMPNLSELIIRTNRIYIDGYQWEDIINQLIKLRVFRLLMNFKIDVDKNLDEETNQILKSFQNKFWLDEHQWFIRCDYNTEYGTTYLYTLPYGFKTFYKLRGDISKSTCPIDKNYCSYKYVNTLMFDNSLSTLASQFSIQFPNIHYLELSFPFDDIFWTIIPKLDRLISLEIISVIHPDESDQPITHLCQLLNRAIYLYSLSTDYLVMSQLSITQFTNKSIRRLDLMANDGHFYGYECISLIQSLLNDRCEILLINIENRTIVIELVEKLSNLRALTFQCQDDRWGDNNETLLEEDELIQWLKQRLPANCSVIRDESEISAIRLWIR